MHGSSARHITLFLAGPDRRHADVRICNPRTKDRRPGLISATPVLSRVHRLFPLIQLMSGEL